MAQSNGYQVDIIVRGTVLDARADGVIPVPFGEDYIIRLTNTNGRRGLAHVALDGQEVTGGGIVVPAYGVVDLERPTDKAVTFRFASTDSKAAAEHGKAGPDTDGTKGLVRVEWQQERGYEYANPFTYARDRSDYEPGSSLRKSPPRRADHEPQDRGRLYRKRHLVEGENPTRTCSIPGGGGIHMADAGPTSLSPSLAKTGIGLSSGVTVEGRHSTQAFRTVHFDIDHSTPSTVIMLKLKGYTREGFVHPQTPLTF